MVNACFQMSARKSIKIHLFSYIPLDGFRKNIQFEIQVSYLLDPNNRSLERKNQT